MTGNADARRARPGPAKREDYRHFRDLPTRWMDNDIYGHVNNATYYSFFDTAINLYLIEQGGLRIQEGGPDNGDDAVIGVAVETGCRFHRSLAFPQIIEAGLSVSHLGTSSVHYQVGLFPRGEEAAAASGHFVHVFVDRAGRRPTAMPPKIRAALARLLLAEGSGQLVAVMD